MKTTFKIVACSIIGLALAAICIAYPLLTWVVLGMLAILNYDTPADFLNGLTRRDKARI